jgi:hypothetical protein
MNWLLHVLLTFAGIGCVAATTLEFLALLILAHDSFLSTYAFVGVVLSLWFTLQMFEHAKWLAN